MRAYRVLQAAIVLLIALSIALWALLTPTAADTPTPTSPPTTTGLLQVTFLDVSQGDAAWLKTPDGWDILIDGGEKGEGPGLVSYLQSHGVTDIEVLVLSHPHADHVGGLIAILENMEVDEALTNCQSYDSAIYQEFQQLLLDKGIPTTCVRDGHNFTWGGISASAVNPPEPLTSDANNDSVVLRISYSTIDFLFTGDIESEAEAEILGRGGTVEAEILKVAHHGSQYSSSAPFLTAVGPETAVISVGPNSYGHPTTEALQRLRDAGATIYRTDLHGTIVVTTDGTSYSVQPEFSYFLHLPFVLKGWSPTPTPRTTLLEADGAYRLPAPPEW